MKGSWIVLGGWGMLLLALAAPALLFRPRAVELALSVGFVLVLVVLATVALVGERRGWSPRPDDGEPSVLLWTSAAASSLGIGIGLVVLGPLLGQWLIGIGALVGALGLGGLVRESRAVRR